MYLVHKTMNFILKTMSRSCYIETLITIEVIAFYNSFKIHLRKKGLKIIYIIG